MALLIFGLFSVPTTFEPIQTKYRPATKGRKLKLGSDTAFAGFGGLKKFP
jgi:hypothetical protein